MTNNSMKNYVLSLWEENSEKLLIFLKLVYFYDIHPALWQYTCEDGMEDAK
jgi:hypothetical protein